MGIVSQRLRDSARGQECTLRIPGVCNHDPETTVLAHIRDETKGMGNKALDISACFACSDCHERLDQFQIPTAARLFYTLRALQRTHKIWRDMGLIQIVGDDPKPKKPSSKTVAPRGMYR